MTGEIPVIGRDKMPPRCEMSIMSEAAVASRNVD